MHVARFDREDSQEFVKTKTSGIIARWMQGVKFSDNLSSNRDTGGEFGRLNCDGRTLARGDSRSTFNSDAQTLKR
jgi:hypothetical protein